MQFSVTVFCITTGSMCDVSSVEAETESLGKDTAEEDNEDAEREVEGVTLIDGV